MVLVNLILSLSFAGYFNDVRSLQCKTHIKEMRQEIKKVEDQIVPYLAEKPKNEVEAKVDLKERDMMFITLIKPEVLKNKLEYAQMYSDCAKMHREFLKTSTKAKLDSWINCVEHNYGRDEVPEIYSFLKKCYQKISR